MRLIPAAAVVACALLLTSCAKPWKPYSYPAWGFAVSYRDPPTVTDTPASPKDGTPRTFRVEGVQGGRDLVVEVEDASASTKTPAQMLSEVPDEIVTSSGGTITAHANVTVDGVTGRDVTIDRGGQPTMRVQVFVANNKLYQLNTQTTTEGDDKEIDQFLASFHFLGT